MPPPTLSDAEFVQSFEEKGAAKLAKDSNISLRNIYDRRQRLERKLGKQITGPDHYAQTRAGVAHPHRVLLDVQHGTILIGSDAHYWPGEPTTAHRAFVKFIKEYKPRAVIMNGDVIDASTVSRHPPIGWEQQPTLVEEIEVAQDRLHEIASAAPKGCKKIWTLGNHDGRFETRLATVAPEYAKLHGMHLKDSFPVWEPAWSAWINDNVVVKHRFKNGIHAPHNNTIWAGRTIITGHLHSAKVMPITDYNGTRYGVDTGCLADVDAKAFVDYSEDNPKSWRSGFCILTFQNGQLLMPELILVWDETTVQFRGALVKV